MLGARLGPQSRGSLFWEASMLKTLTRAVAADKPKAQEPGSTEPRWGACIAYVAAVAFALLLAHKAAGSKTPMKSTQAGLTVLVLLTLLAQFAEHLIEPLAGFANNVKSIGRLRKSELGLIIASVTVVLSVYVCRHWGLYLLSSLGWKAPGTKLDAFVSGVALSGGTKLLHAVADGLKKSDPPSGGGGGSPQPTPAPAPAPAPAPVV
jgi:hypothetical protein